MNIWANREAGGKPKKLVGRTMRAFCRLLDKQCSVFESLEQPDQELAGAEAPPE